MIMILTNNNILDCKDKSDDCASYDREYLCQGKQLPWAELNCAKYCSLGDCAVLTTTLCRFHSIFW